LGVKALNPGARLLGGLCWSIIGALMLAATLASAAEPPAAKAAATLLGERHAAKSLACNACHAEDPPTKAVGTAKCQSCHGNHEKVAARTEKVEPNPHQSHQGPMDCAECHHMHKASDDACARCHVTNWKVP
jgi:hypothetical protein